ncbi:Ethanolamine kinase [Globisporangium polare]
MHQQQELNWRVLLLVTAATSLITAATSFFILRAQQQQQQQQSPHRPPRKNSSVSAQQEAKEEEEEKDDEPIGIMAQEEVIYLNNPEACYDYVVGGKEDADEFDDVKVVVKAICPEWKLAKDEDITVKIIAGGITNRLYRLMWQDLSVLVRLYGDNTEAFIDRVVENKLFALLSEQGFAPTYHGRFTNGRVEGWLEARPLEPEEMGQTSPVNFLGMIGKELGIMHVMNMSGDRSPVMWEKMERFEKLAFETKLEDPAKRAALERLNLPELHKKLQWLKTVLPSELNGDGAALLAAEQDLDEVTKQAVAFASDVVFCHNDALSGNILHNDSWDRVQIIDYEYGGYNFRGFDFANHFCENCGFELDLNLYPGPEQQFAFFKAYMAAAAPELLAQLEANKESKAFFHALYDAVNRYALASHLFWGFWAVVQSGHSKIDFDFLEYAGKRFDAFDAQKSYFFA